MDGSFDDITRTGTQATVGLFIFNRPDTTKRVLDAIATVRPHRLFVVADGPRAEVGSDQERCRETRALLDRIGWPCDVRTNFSDRNLGCKHRVVTGLDWIFSEVDEAILLEDDCVPDPTFFPFCTELLERYRDDERVQMIAGTNALFGKSFSSESYYFSRFYHIWGWATWARAWANYDITMSRWPEMRDRGWLEEILPTAAMVRRATYFFESTYTTEDFAWDYQWVFAGWLRNALSIIPSTNLVTNIGYREDATHTRSGAHPLADLPVVPITFPLKHPAKVEILEAADRYEWKRLNPQATATGRLRALHRRVRNKLRAATIGGR